jgi:hypothetical protein
MATFAPYLTSAATQAESYVNTERTIDHQQTKFQDLLVDCVNLCQEYQVLSAINGSALTLLRNFLQRHPDRLWEILTKIRVCCYDWLGDLRQSNILADTLKAPGVELMPLHLLLLFVEHAWRNEQRVQLALLLRWISYRMADTERPAYATEKQIRDAWEYIFRSGLWEHTDILTGVAIRRDRGRTESTTIGGEMTATQSDYTIIAESLPAEQPPNISSLDLSAGEIVVEQVDESGKVPAIPAVGAAAITVVKQPTAGRKLSKIADQFHIIKLGFERG